MVFSKDVNQSESQELESKDRTVNGTQRPKLEEVGGAGRLNSDQSGERRVDYSNVAASRAGKFNVQTML